MNPVGTDFRFLAHNARNPYEIAFDSFGSIWQTDNDDDGNQWTRLLDVVAGENVGYRGLGVRRWPKDKGSHFHEERPGTMPNVAGTRSESPTDWIVYEGDLLPERFRQQSLRAEPDRRLIQNLFVREVGADLETDA